MQDATNILEPGEANLTPFEEANYNLLMFAEHATFLTQLRELLDRISVVDRMISFSKEESSTNRLLSEREILDITLVTLLDTYDMFVYEA